MNGAVGDFAHCVVFWSAIAGWITAQITKVFCNLATARKGSGMHWLISTGGMPSSHSASVCGLATAVALHCGTCSPEFGIALTFAILTMFDAATVRRTAGLQAKLLNEIVDELFKDRHFSQKKMRELIGHTRVEVFLGMFLGIVVAFLTNAIFALACPHQPSCALPWR